MDILDHLKSREVLLQGVAVASGIGLHLTYFNHGRHGARAPFYTVATLLILLMAGLHRLTRPDATLFSFRGFVLKMAVSSLVGIYSSVFVYRLFLNPLNAFSGPKLARFSDFWLTFQSRHLDWHEKSLALSRKYGPYVRIGSSSLLVVDPASVPVIFGSQTKCLRTEFYSVFGKNRGGITSPVPQIHRDRRRIWRQAFGPSMLRDYESRITTYVDKFVRVLDSAATQGHALDITKWGSYFSWDLMGDIGLGKDFSLMDTGKEHWALTVVAGMMEVIGRRIPIWFVAVLMRIPGAQNAIEKFNDYCNAQLDSQIQGKVNGKPVDSKSILGILLAHAKSSPLSSVDLRHLQSDCQTIIVAGSDTTASTIAFALYYLARQPRDVEKLRQHLLPLMRNGSFKHTDIQGVSHLNGVINEALRLYPPGSVVPRETPPEGVKVGNTYIPGNVTIHGSQYVLGRSEEVYVRPLEFIPERWYERPELVKEKEAYAPFNIGESSNQGST